jgi:hypothetical protein
MRESIRPVRYCALLLTLAVTGCGAATDDLQTVPVTGRVTLDGAPLCSAQIVFIPLDTSGQSLSAAGSTDESGEFILTAATYSGVLPGQYKVLIEHYTMPDGSPVQVDAAIGGLEQMKMMGQVKQALPAAYTSPESSTLTALVTAEKPEGYDFHLKSVP